MNKAKDHVQCKALIEDGAVIARELLAYGNLPLKSLLEPAG